MPIVSKTFDYRRPQRNGTWSVRERHTDSRGRHHHFPYSAASEADADAKFAARDLTEMLKDIEFREFHDHLNDGGAIADFSFIDVSEGEAKTFVRDLLVNERDIVNEDKTRLDAAVDELDNPRGR